MKKLLPFVISIFIFSCTQPSIVESTENILDENLFLSQKISEYDLKEIDSRNLTPLDSNFKKLILVPYFQKEFNLDKNYIISFLESYFLSKHERVGNYTPFTVYTIGDDYESILYFVIDSNNKVTSSLNLCGGHFAGPYPFNDSLTTWGTESVTTITGTVINKESKTTLVNSIDSEKWKSVDIVKLSYKLIQNGEIEFTKKDSIRKRIK